MDGRVLGRPGAPWSRPFTIPANEAFELTAAQRYDLMIEPTRAATYGANFEFLHWISRQVHNNGRGIAATRIIVTRIAAAFLQERSR